MMNQSRVLYKLLGLLVIPLFLVSCSGISGIGPVPTSTLVLAPKIEATVEIRSGMPAYAKPGPYMVGMTPLYISKNDYMVTAYVWYPVQANGTPDTKGGPFPLMVNASGFATPVLEGYSYLLNHLASYGFVTASWEPRMEGDTTSLGSLGLRPQDYQLVVDYIESMAARGGPLEGMIDMKRIAIAGHSMGGGTALERSGAQIDFGWCSAHKDLIEKDQEISCTDFIHRQEIADKRGLKAIPDGKWPQIRDPRIVAMIAMAPVGKLWGAEYESVAAVKVPAMIMTGSNDVVLSPELAAYPVYDHLGSQKKSLVVFEQKDHNLFWGPDYTTGTLEDLDRIKHITTAFLLTEVKGDTEAAKALSPANMNMPGVTYKTTAYNAK